MFRSRLRPGLPSLALAALLASTPGRGFAKAPGPSPVKPTPASATTTSATPPASATPAQPSADEAERLFRQTKPLLDAGRYDEACPILERSQALDPALGTQFNLAESLEHTGHVARAYQHFADVATIAHAAGRAERERAARERLGKLEGQVGFLRVSVESLAALPEATLLRDGEPLPREAWHRPLVVAAGHHSFSASAPQHEPWSTTIEVGARANVEVRVPFLKPSAPSASEAARVAAARAAALSTSTPEPGATQRTFALAAAGLGLAGVAVGATFGALSLSRHNRATDDCPNPSRCPDEASARTWSQATSAGNVSTVGFVTGGLGLGAAALLWFTAPKRESAPTRQGLNVTPPLGGAPAQIGWRGSF